MQRAIAYLLLLVGLFTISAQAALVSGPMISHIDMREAKIWIQVDAPSLVRIAYSVADDSDSLHWTPPVETNNSQANTAVLTLSLIHISEPTRRM